MRNTKFIFLPICHIFHIFLSPLPSLPRRPCIPKQQDISLEKTRELKSHADEGFNS